MVGLTFVGVVAEAVAPGLAGTAHPHPTLTGTAGDAAGILLNNARVLTAPFLLIALGLTKTPGRRWLGDTLMLALTAASTIPVGVELERWQTQLIPYIPQLPLEWGGLAVAVGAWIYHRQGHQNRHIAAFAVTALALITTAAAVETWCTPHRHTARPFIVESQHPVISTWGSVAVSASDFAPPAPVRFKVAGSLSLTLLGSAQPSGGAHLCSQQPPTPTGGITC